MFVITAPTLLTWQAPRRCVPSSPAARIGRLVCCPVSS